MKPTRQIKRLGVVMAVAVVAIGALAGAALATGVSADVTGSLGAGSLQVNSVAAIALGSHAIDGMSGTLTASGDSGTIVAQDLTGSGAGYTIQAQRSAFETNIGTTEAPVLKPLVGTMSWEPAAVTVNEASNTPLANAPVAAESTTTILTGTAATIATAAANKGMGIYDLTFGAEDSQISMSYPADAYAGAYTGTVTVSAVTGP